MSKRRFVYVYLLTIWWSFGPACNKNPREIEADWQKNLQKLEQSLECCHYRSAENTPFRTAGLFKFKAALLAWSPDHPWLLYYPQSSWKNRTPPLRLSTGLYDKKLCFVGRRPGHTFQPLCLDRYGQFWYLQPRLKNDRLESFKAVRAGQAAARGLRSAAIIPDGRVAVIDYRGRLVVLSDDYEKNRALDQVALPGAGRVVWRDGRLLIIAAAAPWLHVFRSGGLPGQQKKLQPLRLDTSVLKLDSAPRSVDINNGLLVISSAAPGRPRRKDGPLTNTGSMISWCRLPGCKQGGQIYTGHMGLSDAFDIRLDSRELYVLFPSDSLLLQLPFDGEGRPVLDKKRLFNIASGSDRLFILKPFHPHSTLAPAMLAAGWNPGALVSFRQAKPLPTVGFKALKPGFSPAKLAETGRFLFWQKANWQQTTPDHFTCNSCHTLTGSDLRLQPGFLEHRFEITRPLGGVGNLELIFSPGQAGDLAYAVEGLFRILDERYWHSWRGRYYEDRYSYSYFDGNKRQTISLEASTARKALLAFLKTLPVSRPLLRRPGEALNEQALKGLTLFKRDCLHCHRPRTALAAARQTGARTVGRGFYEIGADRLADWLTLHPLSFSSNQFAKTGIRPYYTAAGNRVSPLLENSRPGVFFSGGQAADLVSLLKLFDPASGCHRSPCERKQATGKRYSIKEIEQLLEFLLSI